MTTHKLLTCDGKNMKSVADKSVDLVVTSPPYPMIEMWDDVFISQDESIKNDLVNGNGNSAFLKMHIVYHKEVNLHK